MRARFSLAGLGGLALSVVSVCTAAGPESSQPVDALDPVVVTGSAFPTTQLDGIQSIAVITRDQIRAAPASTLAELLAVVAGVDVRRRGGPGVQADVGIRGTAFEQTLVLLNGIPFRDPQTGHHNLNLPVPLAAIERIEIVKGPGGLAFGGHATGGLINIITRTPDAPELAATGRGGSYGFAEGRLLAGLGDPASGHMLSAEYQRSDGHLDDQPTDFKIAKVGYNAERSLGRGTLRWGGGYERKKFGAFKFFTAEFPDQRERTRTRLAWVAGDQRLGNWKIDARGWWRGHDDWFRTRVGGRDFINIHRTGVWGGSLAARHAGVSGETGFGVNFIDEDIDSNALGQRRRTELGAWLSHRRRLAERVTAEAGLAVVDFEQGGSRVLPTLGASWRLDTDWVAFASVGRSSRPASWTEQRLVSGGNLGNPDLDVEDSWQGEAGLRWRRGRLAADLAWFERRSDNLIDWGRLPGTVQWQADEFDNLETRGAEFEWRWQPAGHGLLEEWRINYTWLDSELDARGLQIKFALDHPRHAVNTALRLSPSSNTRLSTTLRHTERRSGRATTYLAVRLAWQPGRFEWFVEADNLLDDEVPEAGFAPQPGRWLFGGVRVGI